MGRTDLGNDVSEHVSDQKLAEYMDGELGPHARARVVQHLRACDDCTTGLDELRSASRRLSLFLRRLDRPVPWEGLPERLREAIEARRSGGADGTGSAESGEAAPRAPRPRRALATAAALLLVAGGVAAAAIPGSPLRTWLGHAADAAVALVSGEDPSADSALPADGEADPGGVAVRPVDGRVSVMLSGAERGARVRVRLVEGGEATVRGGGRYATAPGHIEVLGIGTAELTVELPRSAASARILMDGIVVVEKEGAELHVRTPRADTVGSEILFDLPVY